MGGRDEAVSPLASELVQIQTELVGLLRQIASRGFLPAGETERSFKLPGLLVDGNF